MTAVYVGARDLVALTLIVAGAAKLRTPGVAGDAICRVIGAGLCARRVRGVGTSVAGSEVVLGLALFAGVLPRITAAFAIAATLIFLATSVYGYARLRGADCGCFGELAGSSYTMSMVVRNLGLVVAAVLGSWNVRAENVPSLYIPLLILLGMLVTAVADSAGAAAASVRQLRGASR